MIFKNPKVQKFISSILIILVMLPTVFLFKPREAKAVADVIGGPSNIVGTALKFLQNTLIGTGNVSQATTASVAVKTWYEKILEEVLKAIAKKALQEITKSTINWINGGFHGSPLFIENPKSFFNDIAKSEIKNIVDTFGYNSFKFPFGKDFALNTIATYKNTLENNTSYTLSNVIKDTTVLHNYQNDFNFGGWNGFLINTQYPQNNYLGFQITATEELARRVQGVGQTEVQKIKDMVQQGQGFLSPQKCMDEGTTYNNDIGVYQRPPFNEAEYQREHPYNPGNIDQWQKDHDTAKANWEKTNVCKNLANTTPGSLVSNQITTALSSDFRQSELGAALGNSLSAIFDALLNKFIGDGLNSLTARKNATTTDTWTYGTPPQGLDDTNGSDWASGPDQEVILRDFRILIDGRTVVTFEPKQQLIDENGNLRVYKDKEPIRCVDGDRIVDSTTNETIRNCMVGEILSCDEGQKMVSKEHYEDNIGITCVVKDGDNTQYHKGGDPVLAEGGEVITLVGDKSINKTTGEPILGREYFPGDIENTTQEIALMSNPCEPSDTDCASNPLKTTYSIQTKKNEYTYNPGLEQFIKPIKNATKTLDRCIPGPDKGWEFRLDQESQRVAAEIQEEAGGENSDLLKKKKGDDVVKELKFAVNSFKDWIEVKMMKELRGATFYIEAVREIDDFNQKFNDLTDAKKKKIQALGRLSSIKDSLDKLAKELQGNKKDDGTPDPLYQPLAGSAEEKELVTLKKQYDAVRVSVSSVVTVERAKDDLNKTKEQYEKLTRTDGTCSVSTAKTQDACTSANGTWTPLGMIARCTEQRRAEGWADPDTTGKGLALNSNLGVTEVYKFCGSTPTGGPFTGPIASGYSHGDVSRNDQAAREMNCFPDPHLKKKGGCNDINWDTSSWFIFRNPNAKRKAQQTFTTPNGPFPPLDPEDYGDPGYKDLPMVNAMNILGDDRRIDGTIDCRNVFKARDTDYQDAGDVNSY